MCLTDKNKEDSEALIRKIAGFQNVIPQFDNLSSITPKFFVENLENITELAKCTKPEKLLIMRSRIRGDALTNIIHSPDLNSEKDYDEFKKKFLSYFDTQYSLSARQKQFSNCKMLPNEQVKTYAAKVSLATENFFNSPDLTNDAIKTIFEQTKLAKFIDGLHGTFKQSVILKDPKTFQNAVDFAQLLQSNEINAVDSPVEQIVNNMSTTTNNSEIKNILEAHALNTQEMINALSKEVESLKLQTRQDPPRAYTNYSARPSFQRGSAYPRYTQNRNFTQRNVPTCRICHKSHFTSDCFYNPANRDNFRGRNNGYRRNDRASYSSHNNNRGRRPNQHREYRDSKTSGNY